MNILRGKVVQGAGKGKRFVAVYSKKIAKISGMEPYPGTLNIEVEGEYKLPQGYIIPAFGKYGSIELIPASINKTPVYIVVPEKSDYKNIIEIISAKKLDLRKGNRVIIKC